MMLPVVFVSDIHPTIARAVVLTDERCDLMFFQRGCVMFKKLATQGRCAD